MTLIKKKKPGVEMFSPWYTEELIQEKLDSNSKAIVRRVSLGEIRSAEDWNEKTSRRFKRAWDRLSEKTQASYQDSARNFGKYLGLKRSDSKVSKIVARLIILSYIEASTLIEEYIMWMEDLERAPNTINLRVAAMRWFVDSARRVGWVEWKLDVKSVKGGKVRDTSGPNQAEFRRILRVVNGATGKTAMRDRLLVYMLAFMGLRISSVMSLEMKNIDFEKRRFKVQWKGKGETESRYVWRPVGPETFEALEDWLEVRGREEGPIIIAMNKSSSVNPRLSVRYAQLTIEKIGREAATQKVLTPHAFRHLHATDNLEAEGNTRRVMKSTGHTNVRTIEAYDDADETAAREVSSAMEKRWLEELEDTVDEDEDEIQDRYDVKPDPKRIDLKGLGIVSSSTAAANAVEYERVSTGMPGVDDLLGGEPGAQGLVQGGIVLLGGFPGIGKSTLARQICFNICNTNPDAIILYASGEESVDQIGKSLTRLGCNHDNFLLLAETSINKIYEAAEKLGATAVVVDSVSTVAVDENDKAPGSITQVKAIGQYTMGWCKGIGENDEGSGISVILISHVDKKGNIAGPKALEHHVDQVYSFTSPNKRSNMRSLGCEGKNRYGDASKEMVFKMTDKGLVEQEPLERELFGYDAGEE